MLDLAVLSPHRDDAAFSACHCLSVLSAAGAKITVLNFFTRSAYGPGMTTTDAGSVSAARRREDRRVLARIAETIEVVDGNLVDAPLRLNIPVSAVCDSATQLLLSKAAIDEIGRSIIHLVGYPCLAPLALGNHIDHVTVRAAAIRILRAQNLSFYEDLPYAMWTPEATLRERVGEVEDISKVQLRPVIVRSRRAGTRKRRLIAGYQSQITRHDANEMARWGERYGGGERVWMPVHSKSWRLLLGATQRAGQAKG